MNVAGHFCWFPPSSPSLLPDLPDSSKDVGLSAELYQVSEEERQKAPLDESAVFHVERETWRARASRVTEVSGRQEEEEPFLERCDTCLLWKHIYPIPLHTTYPLYVHHGYFIYRIAIIHINSIIPYCQPFLSVAGCRCRPQPISTARRSLVSRQHRHFYQRRRMGISPTVADRLQPIALEHLQPMRIRDVIDIINKSRAYPLVIFQVAMEVITSSVTTIRIMFIEINGPCYIWDIYI